MSADENHDLAMKFVKWPLFKWGVRTTIGVVIFSLLAWNFTWGKYVLYLWIPMSLFSLAVILIGSHKLKAFFDDMDGLVGELEDAMEEHEAEEREQLEERA